MMKNLSGSHFMFFAVLLLAGSLLLGGCENINPLNPTAPDNPQSPGTPTPAPGKQLNETIIVYNYNDTDKVQLSDNNITLKVGEKLILQPAPGLTKKTRFSSSGENFFGDIMKQETEQDTTRAVFTAIKPGKGKLQIIPDTNDLERAVDLWVTVQ